MSQENVELVLGLQPAPDVDLARLFRDDTSWAGLTATLGPALTQDFECVTRGFPGNDGQISGGIAGMRAVWLEWLAPWESYRTEIEDAIDAGDKVVVLVRDYGLRAEETNEVMLTSAARVDGSRREDQLHRVLRRPSHGPQSRGAGGV